METESIKLFLIGDCLTGKTCALSQFCKREINDTILARPVIRLEIDTIDLDGKKIRLRMWDAPSEFRYINDVYYANTNGVMLFYDITNRKSFDHIRLWIKLIKENAPEDVEIMLLGNKCELDEKRAVTKEMGEQLALEYKINFIEISAKQDIRVKEAFFTLAKLIKAKRDKKFAENNPPIGQFRSILQYFKSFTTNKAKIKID